MTRSPRLALRFPFVTRSPVVGLVRLEGMIAAGGGRLGGSALSDASVAPLLERAFRRGRPAAVALVVNSPGGSPVQSALIAGRIQRLSEECKVPVLAFVEDVAASGGYFIASAADEIFADASSIVGSIGVISAGFGFPSLLERIGVERRVHVAGASKSFLDPFQPERPEDIARLRSLQDDVHESFIGHVKARRGARLVRDDIFDGSFWTGRKALEIGLIDGIGHPEAILSERFGSDVRILRHGRRRALLPRFGARLAADILDHVEERALRARLGA